MSFFDSFGAAANTVNRKFSDIAQGVSGFIQNTALPLAQSVQQLQQIRDQYRQQGRPAQSNVGATITPGETAIVTPTAPAVAQRSRAIPWALIGGVVVVGYLITRKR